MRKQTLWSGLLMTVLALLILVGRHADADAPNVNAMPSPDLRGNGDIYNQIEADFPLSEVSEWRTKIVAGSNANATVTIDLIPNGGAGNQRDDGVTSGTVSGQGTKIAVEVFAKGVTTPLRGMAIKFDFDTSVLTFVKAENSAFALSLPESDNTGTNFAATTPVTLGSAGFLARAEFSTVVDVTNKAFTLGIQSVTLAESVASSDVITTTDAISFNANVPSSPAASSSDFDGDGMVGTADFLLFAYHYGSSLGDGTYQAKYDLDSNGVIGLSDVLIFVNNFGSQVSSSGGGGGSSGSPDLVVGAPSVSDNTLTTGQSFTLSTTVRNQGNGQSAATTLRYYHSSNSTISRSDTQVGTDSVSGLSASGTSAESISLNAPSSAGTYYYGACVASVNGESNTNNNCSTGVRVTVSSSSGGGGATVTIADANLRAVIADSLGKARNAPITRAEMATLTRLDAPNKGIRSLTGLEHATNLQVLDLGLVRVNDEWVNSNAISNLSPLSNLTNLTWLSLTSNSVSSISVLSNLTNLTGLHLGDNSVSSISALSNLTNLTSLNLWGNSISDISALSTLTNLTVLDLWGNSISDISALSTLTNLTWLGLYNNSISDISALSNLTNLTWLYLYNNSISDISALSTLTNLTGLGLGGNSISDISALSTLTNLTGLSLDYNSISDISPLVANTGLGRGDEVNLRSNPLSSTSINTHIPALQRRGVTVEFDSSSGGSSGGGGGGSSQTCTVGLAMSPGEGCDGSGYSLRNDSGVLVVNGNIGGIQMNNARYDANSVQLNRMHLTRSDNVWTIVSLP